jgi:hypothetical protein
LLEAFPLVDYSRLPRFTSPREKDTAR